ncbi:MAG: PHP domain-containing protein [Cellulosilyticaceae bacterium]
MRMIDGHVHLERGPYTREWMTRFVEQAQVMGITRLYMLEHTHRFEEFTEVYESIFKDEIVAKEQTEWFYKKPKLKIEEYIVFAEQMKRINWPIEVKFGLEVCYFPEKEELLRQKLDEYPWDFLIGSVHWIDGWGFDNAKTKWSWERKNVDAIYQRYYEVMIQLVESKLFNSLGHPDSIKCFGYYPRNTLTGMYHQLAMALRENNVKTEFSAGLHINYNHEELGPNKELFQILLEHQVEFVVVSDAHRPEDVGKYIKEGLEIINNYMENICIQE